MMEKTPDSHSSAGFRECLLLMQFEVSNVHLAISCTYNNHTIPFKKNNNNHTTQEMTTDRSSCLSIAIVTEWYRVWEIK
jgi:hypothetical protein